MKKVFLFLLAATIFACSDDDNDNVDNGLHDPYTGEVTGEWRTASIGFSTNDMLYVPECDEPPAMTEVNYYYNFNTDGTVEVYNSCDVDGVLDDEVPLTVGTYQTTGNVFTININGSEGKAHMVDYLDEYNALELRFDIGNQGLFYGYHVTIEQQP